MTHHASTLGHFRATKCIATLAISSSCTLFELTEMPRDDISQEIPPPTNIVEHLISIGRAHPPNSFDEDFTLYEFRAVLDIRRRRSAPGEDGITYKAFRNLNHSFHHVILDMYNMVL